MHLEDPTPSISSRNTAGRLPVAAAIASIRLRKSGPAAESWLRVAQPPTAGCRKYVVNTGIDPGSAVRLWQKIFWV